MWTNDELAYDGSSRPQARELTPRERDITCRLLFEVWYHAAKNNTEYGIPVSVFDAVPISMQDNDLQTIYEVFKVLNPRED